MGLLARERAGSRSLSLLSSEALLLILSIKHASQTPSFLPSAGLYNAGKRAANNLLDSPLS